MFRNRDTASSTEGGISSRTQRNYHTAEDQSDQTKKFANGGTQLNEMSDMLNESSSKRWFLREWPVAIAIAITLVHLLFYLTEYLIILNLLWNSPHHLEKCCDSGDNCFNIEQHYEWTRGRLQAERFLMFEHRSKLAPEISLFLSTAALKTPEIITSEFLDPEHWQVDHANFPFSCDIFQIAAGFALESLSFKRSHVQQRILQIGMGGGSATGYLSIMPLNLSMDVIELEQNVYEAAKKWFAFPSSPNIKVHIMDGVVFAKEAAANGNSYDLITLDASSNDPDTALKSPHQVFLQEDVIEALSKLVGAHGVLSVNLFMLDDKDRLEKDVISKFSAHFKSCFTLKWETDTKLLICSNRIEYDWATQRKRILANLASFDGMMRLKLASYLDQLNPEVV